MKLFARILALSLVATGAVASTHIANTPQTAVSARVSAIPVPTCDPTDPDACGIVQSN